MSVEVRRVDEPIYDGTTGDEVDTVTRYELGAEVDGAWVSFASKSSDHVDALVQRAKQNQPTQTQTGSQPQGDTGAPQSPAVPTTPQTDQSAQG